MNYRELQAALKQFRNDGITPKTFKLNQKKTILMEEYERVTNIATSPEKTTDEDEVARLKIKIAELESENKALQSKLTIANETITILNESLDSNAEKIDAYIENVTELVKESYQSGYNDGKKDMEKVEIGSENQENVSIAEEVTSIVKYERNVGGIEIADIGNMWGYSPDDTIAERLEKQVNRLEESMTEYTDTVNEVIESSARLGYEFRKYEETVTKTSTVSDIAKENEYEVVECEFGEVLDIDETFSFD